jgi:hypothetical protein
MNRRRGVVAVVAAVGALALAGPLTATPAAAVGAVTAPTLAQRFGIQQVPKQVSNAAAVRSAFAAPDKGTNPYIGLLPDGAKPDYAYWRAVLHDKAAKRAGAKAAAKANQLAGLAPAARAAAEPLLVDEAEPDAVRGGNDTPATAQFVPQFGTGRGKRPAARVLGTLAPSATPLTVAAGAEDDGAIPLAGDTLLTPALIATRADATIGDGPHGSAGDQHGDFDFFVIRAARAGQRLVVDIDTPTSTLDSVVTLWDSAGNPIAVNDDDGTSFDSLLTTTIPAAGDYYVSVSGFGFGSPIPPDPFDPASGSGVGSEGGYSVSFGLDASDLDHFSVDLKAGDVLGGSITGTGTRLTVFDPAGREVIGSTQDASFIYPASSPLPGGGNAVFAHVAAKDGRYAVEVNGKPGNYDLTLEAYRPGTETAKATQTIFLDFDGARVNTNIWGGPGVRQLSPFSAFVGRWGLTAADENALVDRVVATVSENLKQDFAAKGVKVKILNSRDNADPFGRPNVSRVIIGGTIAESGISTIGIAQSIDPGNFETADSALVLLDVLSDPTGSASLNTYLTSTGDRVKFVGTAVGNVVSHESGHFLGSFHVDQFNDVLNLMDQGGNFPLLYGVGPDGVGGTADDPDVDFGEDIYNPNEGFTGTEDTAANTRFGLAARR